MLIDEGAKEGLFMKKKFRIGMLLVLLMLTACGNETQNEKETEIKQQTTVLETEDIAGPDVEPAVAPDADIEAARGRQVVVIYAQVKEIQEQKLLIRSDAELFPGAFSVEVPGDVFDTGTLQGGDSIRITMENKNSRNQEGLAEYIAQQIDPAMMGGAYVGEDILPLEPPAMTLTDMLSSRISKFTIMAGNTEWNYKTGQTDELVSYAACGTAPLEEAHPEAMPTLSVPEYNLQPAVTYSVTGAILPDQLILKEWEASDIGEAERKACVTTTVYGPDYFLHLSKGKIYSIYAIWEESKLEERGFYGFGEYVFRTQG